MANQLNCLRCGAGMQFIKREKFQLGQTGWFCQELSSAKEEYTPIFDLQGV